MEKLAAELLQAFSETDYIVHHEPPFTMKVGTLCPALKALIASENVFDAAFVTAWNPFSQQLSRQQNEARQDELKTELKARGLKWIEGIGQHPSNGWPGEQSLLILGLSKEATRSLARHHGQHAAVWADRQAVPELVVP